MFNKRLHELRTICRLSQQNLSKQLNIPLQSIIEYEQGTKEPDSSILIKLAELFDVSVDYLLSRTDFYIQPVKEPIRLLEDEQELLDLYKSCSPNLKKYIIYKIGVIKYEGLPKQEEAVPKKNKESYH